MKSPSTSVYCKVKAKAPFPNILFSPPITLNHNYVPLCILILKTVRHRYRSTDFGVIITKSLEKVINIEMISNMYSSIETL